MFLLSKTISCDQNLNRCCELIELTAKLQSQLFAILNLAAAEGRFDIWTLTNKSLIYKSTTKTMKCFLWIRRPLCWSGHPENSTAALAWNFFLYSGAFRQCRHQLAAHEGTITLSIIWFGAKYLKCLFTRPGFGREGQKDQRSFSVSWEWHAEDGDSAVFHSSAAGVGQSAVSPL